MHKQSYDFVSLLEQKYCDSTLFLKPALLWYDSGWIIDEANIHMLYFEISCLKLSFCVFEVSTLDGYNDVPDLHQ